MISPIDLYFSEALKPPTRWKKCSTSEYSGITWNNYILCIKSLKSYLLLSGISTLFGVAYHIISTNLEVGYVDWSFYKPEIRQRLGFCGFLGVNCYFHCHHGDKNPKAYTSERGLSYEPAESLATLNRPVVTASLISSPKIEGLSI